MLNAAIKRIFISSTVEDLKPYRAAAKEAVVGLGHSVDMQEYWSADDRRPPYDECMARIDRADAVLVIVAHRYGWEPLDQPDDGDPKSITWLECLRAAVKKPVFAFVLDEQVKWPTELREEYESVRVMKGESEYTLEQVKRRIERLEEFKRWLGSRAIRKTFRDAKDLGRYVSEAILKKWPERTGASPPGPVDAGPYLNALASSTGEIDIRGIERALKKATPVSIVDLYIPLSYQEKRAEEGRGHWKARVHEGFDEVADAALIESEKAKPLEAALEPSPARLLVVGDPGTGKSTFSRRLAYEACQALRGKPLDEDKRLLRGNSRFPILARLSSLAEFIVKSRQRPAAATAVDESSPEWLLLFLSAGTKEHNRHLPREFVREKLQAGALVILDGLDEASESARDDLVRLIEELPQSYEKSDFVVTSRPSAFGGVTDLKRFRSIKIGPLANEAIETFTHAWCASLYDAQQRETEQHRLAEAIGGGDIAVLARNPLMLTCLAVLRWNRKAELPDRRAELYDLILTWLAQQREGEDRPGWEHCLELHQQLALAMHTQKGDKQVELDVWAGVKALSGPREFRDLADEDDRRRAAQRFLQQEENDSGIIKGENHKLRFWHQQFQECLAAQGLCDATAKRRRILFEEGKLHDPDWRETVLLLAGTQLKSSRLRLDDFLVEVIDSAAPPGTSLENKARTLGLIGAMLRDVHSSGYRCQEEKLLELVEDAMEVFGVEASRSLDQQLRADCADAIGLICDRRLKRQLWVLIPEGEFWMGSQQESRDRPNYDPSAQEPERLHMVRVKAFEIGQFPVTVAEFEKFVRDGGYSQPDLWAAGGYGKQDRPRDWTTQVRYPSRPVVGVSWFEASAYAVSIGARLPTEAEWERAARFGGEVGIYPWGDEEPDETRANFRGLDNPTAVGLYPLGATGHEQKIYDMAGNVWEWCADWFGEDYYESSPAEDPKGPPEGSTKVVRGGSWFSGDPTSLRSSCRGGGQPVDWGVDVGFRCVREV